MSGRSAIWGGGLCAFGPRPEAADREEERGPGDSAWAPAGLVACRSCFITSV